MGQRGLEDHQVGDATGHQKHQAVAEPFVDVFQRTVFAVLILSTTLALARRQRR